MDKKEIEKILTDNWIKKDSGHRNYERAKKIICPPREGIICEEYEHRIRLITQYLKI